METQIGFPIVLTGTVTPNVSGGAITNSELRLAEYRQAINFYQNYGVVIFLENSVYPLEDCPDFKPSETLKVHRFKPSSFPERGKGFQEFEMIDNWLTHESCPPVCWLKVTGRYIVRNIGEIIQECQKNNHADLLIDQAPRKKIAKTSLFWSKTQFYLDHMAGVYRACDDRKGLWIERMLYARLRLLEKGLIWSFATQHQTEATAGGSGQVYSTGQIQWKVKQTLRTVNRIIDRKRLWYI